MGMGNENPGSIRGGKGVGKRLDIDKVDGLTEDARKRHLDPGDGAN